MAMVTWKGEPGPGDDEGPKQTEWVGMIFKKGEAVEVTREDLIAKAQNNRYFEVSGAPAPTPQEAPKPETGVYRAPSEMSAQKPAAKPGEPVKPGYSPEPVVKAVPKV